MRGGFLFLWIGLVGICVLAWNARAAEVLPPKPANYFNDYAGVVSPATAKQLDAQLREFERATSNQIVVAVFPKLQTDSSLDDYAFRIFESWKVGQSKLDNGAVLFVFLDPRRIRIQVGYGLEGALPDITAKQIIENDIKPAFQAGNYDAGLSAGVAAILKATRGEYKGTGRTAGDRSKGRSVNFGTIVFLFILGFVLLSHFRNRRVGTSYSSRGRRDYGGGGWFPMSGGWGGSSGRGGGFSDGGFSGGGGSSGGGGASGDW